MTSELHFFGEGLLAAGYLVAALFFLRFWRESGDRLFAFFAWSFALLAAQRAMLVLVRDANDHTVWMYVVRLMAYLLILVAIFDKNRAEQAKANSAPAKEK